MAQGNGGSRAQQVETRFGLPNTVRFIGPFPFGGMDTQASRLAMADTSFFWCENYLKIGDGNLRTVPDLGTPLYKVPVGDTRTIISFFWFNIGITYYCAIFFDDGSAIQVDLIGNVTDIVASGTRAFYFVGGQLPAAVQWGSIYLLMSNNNTPNDYWAWDGSILYAAGGLGPQTTLTSAGANYVGQPTIIAFGGHGSGIALSADVTNGSITAINVIDPGTGYVVGDIVQAIFSGGGSDTGARLGSALSPAPLNEIIVLVTGSGYLSPPLVSITGGGGSGAAATANLTGTQVTSITLTNPGSGYTSAPVIALVPTSGGSGGVAQATVVASPVGAIGVADGGTNYFGIPALTIEGGSGSGATAHVVLSGPGPIETITVDNGGSGFTSLPAVDITDGGAGTGATALVTGISGGVITQISITAGGTDYISPVVGFTGGGGSGAAATANIGAGVISSVVLDTPGAGYTDAPTVIVQAGLNSAASATLQLMPFGVSGDSIETYSSQVWVQHPFQSGTPPTGGVRLSSAPGSIADFATSSGGLQEVNTDRFLRAHLTAIRQANGFLYPFGDSSANVISNVQVQGNPPTKTLTSQNTDPQTGTNWRDTMQDFSRTIVFGNPFGIYGLFGGAVTKISGPMDGVFQRAALPQSEDPRDPGQPVTPSSAVANLYNRKIYLMLMSIFDPFIETYRNAMVCWNEKDWSIVSQSAVLTYIGTQEIDSDLEAWGTDGNALYPLLAAPSDVLQKILATKLYGAERPNIIKRADDVYIQAENFATNTRAPAFEVVTDTEFASFPAPRIPQIAFPPNNPLPASAVAPAVQCPMLTGPTGDIAGVELGLTIRSTDPDHAIYGLTLAHEDVDVIFG